MRSDTQPTSARRARRAAARRSRRRPILVIGGLVLAAACTAGMTATAPVADTTATTAVPRYALASSIQDVTVTVTGAPAAEDADAAADVKQSAEASLAAAASVTADIQSSGLDVGEPDPTVDTTALEAAIDRLESADGVADAFLADIADDVAELVAPVDQRVSQLRGSLEGAQQRKAEEEAAEKARIEAEAAAAAAAAEAEEAATASPSAGSGSTGGSRPPSVPTYSGDTSAGAAQAAARAMLPGYGWGDDQFGCLVALWDRESGWNYQAYNRSSGAYGIPQALPGSKMASAGADWETNPSTQIAWGLGYISGRYGSPCGAWDHSESVGWY